MRLDEARGVAVEIIYRIWAKHHLVKKVQITVRKIFTYGINEIKQNGINENDFDRIKKMIYGGYVKEYNDVAEIARMFLSDSFKGINSFDYIEEIGGVNAQYGKQVLNTVFNDDKMVLSTVKK